MNKHKSCEHREHGGRDQSQVKNKSLKSSKKVSPFRKDVPKSHNDDRTYRDLLKLPKERLDEWKAACKRELDALNRRHIFDLVERPKG